MSDHPGRTRSLTPEQKQDRFPTDGPEVETALARVLAGGQETGPTAAPPLSDDAKEWRAQYERRIADGTLFIRPVSEQLADVFEELGIQ